MKDTCAKKAVAASLSLTLALGSVPAVALADSADDGDNQGSQAEQEANYRVIVSANGGTFANGLDYLTLESDSNSFDVPETPTRSGYTFKGWYVSSSLDGYPPAYESYLKFNFSNPSTHTAYAIWEESETPDVPDTPDADASYDVNYSANGGVFADGTGLQQGVTDSKGYMREPAKPTRDGYTFKGWYWCSTQGNMTDEQLESQRVDFSNPVSSNANIFALWDEDAQTNEFNIVYVANGGSFVTGEDFQQGMTDSNGIMPQPAAPSRDGYTFAGWYWCSDLSGLTDEQKESQKVDFKVPTKGNSTIFAQWVKNEEEADEFNVLYAANGGQFATGETFQQGVTDSEGIMREPAAPSKEGYTFDGWFWHSDLSGMNDEQREAERVDFSQPVKSNVTIYAQWTKNAEVNDYNVLYAANGGQFATGETFQQGVTDSEGIMREPAAPTRDGYTFDGWYWHADLSQMTEEQKKAEKVDFSQPVQSDVTIFAQWTKNEEPAKETDVLYVANGGKFVDGNDTMQGVADSEGIMRQPAAPTRDGYTFDGWYWHADLSGLNDEQRAAEKVDFSKPLAEGTEHVTLFAQWTKNEEPAVNEYEVNYVANGGKFVDGNDTQQGVTDSDGIMRQPAAPTRDGYTFDGWYWHADLSQMTDEQKAAEKVDFTQPVQSNVNIYAQWTKNVTPVEKVTVTFVDDFNKTSDDVEIAKGETVAQPANPSYDGYTFEGWSTTLKDENGNWLYTPVDFTQPVEEDVTYYAFYTENEKPGNGAVDDGSTSNGTDNGVTNEAADNQASDQATDDQAASKDSSVSPQTGDATNVAAVAGIGGIAGLLAAAAAFFRRRNNN